MFKPLHKHNFKYTLSKERIEWCKGAYSTIGSIVKVINQIQFDTYEFEGLCNIGWYNADEEPIMAKQTELLVKTKPKTTKYQITGGTAYEILNMKYPEVKLRKYVDPTGDIDIVIQSPLVNIVDNIDNTMEPFITLFNQDGTTLNNYYQTFMHWILDKFVELLENINLTTKFKPFDLNTEYPERHIPQEHKTSEHGYKYVQVGNCYVVCYLDRIDAKMIKIQLVGKIGATVDHLVEFIIIIPNEEYNLVASANQTRSVLNIMNVNNINIQPFNELVDDNVSAYLTRYIYPQRLEYLIKNNNKITNQMEKQFLHKSTNHVGRLIYLLELARYVKPIERKAILLSFNTVFGVFNKDKFNAVFPGNNKEIYTNAYFYYFELKNGKYVINKIKIVDLLAEYSSVFASDFNPNPFSFMGIVVNASNKTSTQELITKNDITSKYNYFTRKSADKTASSKETLFPTAKETLFPTAKETLFPTSASFKSSRLTRKTRKTNNYSA